MEQVGWSMFRYHPESLQVGALFPRCWVVRVEIKEAISGQSLAHGIVAHPFSRNMLGGCIKVDEQGRIAQHQRGRSAAGFVQELLELQGH